MEVRVGWFQEIPLDFSYEAQGGNSIVGYPFKTNLERTFEKLLKYLKQKLADSLPSFSFNSNWKRQ